MVHKCVCINDVDCDDDVFEAQKKMLIKTLAKKFPSRSSFETNDVGI